MNTRQGVLVTVSCASLFMNFASFYWPMWAVLTTSLFALTVTDFMFFEVSEHRCGCLLRAIALHRRRLSASRPRCSLAIRALTSACACRECA
jgi:hypothetical protein